MTPIAERREPRAAHFYMRTPAYSRDCETRMRSAMASPLARAWSRSLRGADRDLRRTADVHTRVPRPTPLVEAHRRKKCVMMQDRELNFPQSVPKLEKSHDDADRQWKNHLMMQTAGTNPRTEEKRFPIDTGMIRHFSARAKSEPPPCAGKRARNLNHPAVFPF